MRLIDQLPYVTVRLCCESDNGTSTGSGFFYHYNLPNGNIIPVIVTNKHVIEDANNVEFVMKQSDSSYEPLNVKEYKVGYNKLMESVVLHPNPEVDLCAIKISNLLNHGIKNDINFFYKSLDKQSLPSAKDYDLISSIEEVLMIGYPDGLWDEINLMPIVRKGITATDPKLNYNGEQEFLIDAACFPGSSGSPIFLVKKSPYYNKKMLVMGEDKIFLLGILYAGPLTELEGEIILDGKKGDSKPYVLTNSMLNLGQVIKAERIEELLPLFNF